jgi:hypothetical protein
LEQALQGGQGVPKDELQALPGTEQVAQHGERAPFDPSEEYGRALGLKYPALDGSGQQIGIDFPFYPDKVSGGFQVLDALSEIDIAHCL